MASFGQHVAAAYYWFILFVYVFYPKLVQTAMWMILCSRYSFGLLDSTGQFLNAFVDCHLYLVLWDYIGSSFWGKPEMQPSSFICNHEHLKGIWKNDWHVAPIMTSDWFELCVQQSDAQVPYSLVSTVFEQIGSISETDGEEVHGNSHRSEHFAVIILDFQAVCFTLSSADIKTKINHWGT
jgi:hypothetical protein